MALITGGNLLVGAMVAILFMVVVVSATAVMFLDLDSRLSASLVGITDQEQVVVSEKNGEEVVTKELDSEEARKLLGFIEYPVVNIKTGEINVFSPEAVMNFLRLSEEKIAERCAHITIPFNHARCMRAERACAAVIESSNEHWQCLHEYAFYIGKKL